MSKALREFVLLVAWVGGGGGGAGVPVADGILVP